MIKVISNTFEIWTLRWPLHCSENTSTFFGWYQMSWSFTSVCLGSLLCHRIKFFPISIPEAFNQKQLTTSRCGYTVYPNACTDPPPCLYDGYCLTAFCYFQRFQIPSYQSMNPYSTCQTSNFCVLVQIFSLFLSISFSKQQLLDSYISFQMRILKLSSHSGRMEGNTCSFFQIWSKSGATRACAVVRNPISLYLLITFWIPVLEIQFFIYLFIFLWRSSSLW